MREPDLVPRVFLNRRLKSSGVGLRSLGLVVGLSGLAACGPGQFANSGGSFGNDEAASETGASEAGSTSNGSTSNGSTTSGGSGPDFGGSAEWGNEGETETADDWTDDWTEPGDGDGDPEPIVGDCTPTWMLLDASVSHGHIGATPIGPAPGGDFLTVNPVMIDDHIGIVDAQVRRWSPDGAIVWSRLVSWGELRDDPLASTVDELGDLVLAGRTNTNTLDEDALIAKLDSDDGAPMWAYLRGERGGYSSVVSYGPTVVAIGTIGAGATARIEVVALDGDTGALVWSAEPYGAVAGGGGENPVAVHGLEVVDGEILVLATVDGRLELDRLLPPSAELETVAVLAETGTSTPALARSGPEHVAAVYRDGDRWAVDRIERATGAVASATLPLIEGVPVGRIGIVELGGGQALAIATTVDVAGDAGEIGTAYLFHLDAELELLCSGSFTELDLGLVRTPKLRGLTAGVGGTVYTHGFVDIDRRSVFARWD
jgi:hypothetical protein